MTGQSQSTGPLAAHETVRMLSAYLTSHGAEHEIVEHEPAFTAASEARAAGFAPQDAAKSVVLTDHGAYMLALVPASERLSLAKVRDVLDAGDSLRLADEHEIAEHFAQFEVGAVPPVGHVLFAAEIVDRRIAELPHVLCSGGDHRHSVLLDPGDLIRLAQATVADVCED